MADVATNCTADLVTRLSALSGQPLRDNVLQVVSEDDFNDKSKLLKAPFAGVMYSGLRAEGNLDPSRQGMGARLVVAVIFGFTSVVGHDYKGEAWDMLGQARRAIRMQRSPTGHKWRFVSEAYVGVMKGTAFYVQTWDTMAPLTGENA